MVSEVVGPRANSSDVETKVVLVWSRADSERVELTRILSTTGNLHPLPCFVVKVEWSLEVNANYERWKDVGTNHSQLLRAATDTNNLIKNIDTSWTKEEVSKQWVLDKATRPVQEHKNVERDVEVVSHPKGLEGVATSVLSSKHVNDDCN